MCEHDDKEQLSSTKPPGYHPFTLLLQTPKLSKQSTWEASLNSELLLII